MHTDSHRYFQVMLHTFVFLESAMIHEPLTEKIIGCAMKVANTLGCGFLEKVYENALAHELRKNGLHVQQQVPVPVHYDGVVVGEITSQTW